MRTWTHIFVMVAIANSAALGAEEPGCELPTAQTVTYWMREVPEDPNSAVVFGVTLKLQAEKTVGSALGWRVLSAEFYEVDAGAPTLAWVQPAPNVGTEDGLWWITHGDPGAPELAEFTMPPLLSGTATALNANEDDLEYWLEGSEGNQPLIPGYTVMAFLSYQLQTSPGSTPIRNGSDEPTEVDDDTDAPVM